MWIRSAQNWTRSDHFRATVSGTLSTSGWMRWVRWSQRGEFRLRMHRGWMIRQSSATWIAGTFIGWSFHVWIGGTSMRMPSYNEANGLEKMRSFVEAATINRKDWFWTHLTMMLAKSVYIVLKVSLFLRYGVATAPIYAILIINFAVMCKHGYCHSRSILSALTKCSGYDTDQ